jgi:hypothetical protein
MLKVTSARTLLSSMATWLQGRLGRHQNEPLRLSWIKSVRLRTKSGLWSAPCPTEGYSFYRFEAAV